MSDFENDNEYDDEGNFIEVSAKGVEEVIFNAEVTWSDDEVKWPFEKGFEDKLSLALGVYQNFIQKGYEDFPSFSQKNLEGMFLHISLIDDEQMREINHTHRNKDKTTDVLSFPLFESLRSGEEMIFGELEFGDIIISVPVMNKQAIEFEVTPEGEFFHLLTHGFLHLCGYDHEISDEEEKIMESHEQRLINEIYSLIYKK